MVPGTLDWDWVGNSHSKFTPDAENGVGRWVQNFIDEMEVAPDGTVVVGCDWDEGGRCLGLYKDATPNGACLGKNNRGGGHRNGGWGTSTSAMTVSGNEILCASNDGEFFRFSWTPGDIESARYVDGFKNGFGDAVNDKLAVKVIGMNARDGRVAILLADGRVQVRAQKDWAVQKEFRAEGALDLCWGANGMLWIATAKSVIEVTLAGKATGRSLPDVGAPSAVALAPDGRLVVCDDGPRQQVRWYDVVAAQPKLQGVFGDEGGIASGMPGKPEPKKLMRPAGANFDAAGNLYVGLRYDELSPTGGFLLRSFDPAGKLRWEQAGHVFSECWDVVPEKNGDLTAYGFRSTFVKKAAAPRGAWALDAITLDTTCRPQDPRYRLALLQATTTMRELDGTKYLFTWGSGGNSALYITRLDAKGRLAEPVATIGEVGPWAFEVDAKGGIWWDENHAAILHRRYLGKGQWGAPEKFPLPTPMVEVERLCYDVGNDVMYASGYTDKIRKPDGEWGLMGRALLRIDHFTTQPAVAWTSGVKVDDDNLPPKAVCWAGDYLFTAACKPTAGLRGQIYVYRVKNGSFVGRISAPKEIAQNTGWIDLSHGLRARVDQGTYYLTQEDNLRAKVILHIWKP